MTKREAAFHWTVNVTEAMSQAKSEMGTLGVIGLIAVSYLLRVEKKCHQALTAISDFSEGHRRSQYPMRRRT